jgi:hypothetical protein
MILHWLFRCWANLFATPRYRPRPELLRLALVTLEGRATPSVTTAIYVDQSPDMVFDFMTFHRDKPDRWAVDLERRDGPDEASQSPETMTGAACAALLLGTAAIAPYDREEDARWGDVFHGIQVA